MNCAAAVVCILLGWSEPTAALRRDTAAPVQKAVEGPTYEVMQVKSGIEIVVKMGGKPISILLSGVDTPRTGAKPGIDRLSQTNYLRTQLTVGSKVRLDIKDATKVDAQGRRRAQVFRVSDGLWVNRDLVAQGYATALPESADRTGQVFREAEQQARELRIGMWAPDFAAHAAQPARFDRVQRSRVQPRPSLPEAGMDVMPADTGVVPFVNVPVANNGGYGFGPNFGLGFGSPILTLGNFAFDAAGNRLTEDEQRRRYQNWLAAQARQDERAGQVAGEISRTIRDQRQAGQGSATGMGGNNGNPAGQNNSGTGYTPYTPYTPYSVPITPGTNAVPLPFNVSPPAVPGPGTGHGNSSGKR